MNRNQNMDWVLVISLPPLLLAGLSIIGLGRQLVWIGIGFLIFFIFSFIDWRFLKNSGVLFLLLVLLVLTLSLLFFWGDTVRGATSWFNLNFFSVEPAEPGKLLIILILAKYFSRRHIEIAQFRHILTSGLYVGIPAFLVFIQPDLGSATVFFFIWLSMIMVSGVSKKHLLLVFSVVVLLILVSWFFVLRPYQKERIVSFIDPLEDPRGTGYNALQSMIAIGSGQVWGKGLGYGTQSRLDFLPEHKTDFVFAAFAEEWGFIGVLIIFLSFAVLIFRILKNAYFGQTNFEKLFGIGLSIFLMTHFVLHVGMNVGFLPITGLNMPFLSYGGSNLITVFAGLGILMGMRRYSQRFSQNIETVDVL